MTEQNNICRFVPREINDHSIHTVHFVLETEEQLYTGLRIKSLYTVYLVTGGTGRLHTQGEVLSLKQGDVFFTFPAVPFAIESVSDFQYMYISFLGARGNRIMEKLGISSKTPLYPDCEALTTVWTQGLHSPAQLSDIASEAVLLHTLAFLGGKLSKFSEKDEGRTDLISMIQKYVDEHFSDADFSLERLGNDLKYNKKYLSTVFKRHVGVGIVDYLHTVRIQHACTMLKQGFTSVSDVALRCGYPDAQYFSKVFKRRMNLSPREYMASVKNEGTFPRLPE
ncbi:MAG: AraC family transcriptional regulator [Clostridia bacterium]|jgi:AraC-like DNA-binding protein|nr:AraC family transcriptional regulator [Clostridia bacterium]MBQ5793457.1 AraC family transcriptional regulator [Clostridia bacterium]